MGQITREDETMTENCKQTLEVLAQTHFPDLVIGPAVTTTALNTHNRPTANEWKITDGIFTPNIESNGCSIFPALVQKGSKVLNNLRNIFRASYLLNYIPKAAEWLRSLYQNAVKRP